MPASSELAFSEEAGILNQASGTFEPLRSDCQPSFRGCESNGGRSRKLASMCGPSWSEKRLPMIMLRSGVLSSSVTPLLREQKVRLCTRNQNCQTFPRRKQRNWRGRAVLPWATIQWTHSLTGLSRKPPSTADGVRSPGNCGFLNSFHPHRL